MTYHDKRHGKREHHDLPVLDTLDPVLLVQNLVQRLGCLREDIHCQFGSPALLFNHNSGSWAGYTKKPVNVLVVGLDPPVLEQVAVPTNLGLVQDDKDCEEDWGPEGIKRSLWEHIHRATQKGNEIKKKQKLVSIPKVTFWVREQKKKGLMKPTQPWVASCGGRGGAQSWGSHRRGECFWWPGQNAQHCWLCRSHTKGEAPHRGSGRCTRSI